MQRALGSASEGTAELQACTRSQRHNWRHSPCASKAARRTQVDGLQQDLALVHAPNVGQEVHGAWTRCSPPLSGPCGSAVGGRCWVLLSGRTAGGRLADDMTRRDPAVARQPALFCAPSEGRPMGLSAASSCGACRPPCSSGSRCACDRSNDGPLLCTAAAWSCCSSCGRPSSAAVHACIIPCFERCLKAL